MRDARVGRLLMCSLVVSIEQANAARMKTVSRGAACAVGTLCCSSRRVSTDIGHMYLRNVHVVQPDGLDGIQRTKADQQMWLNTEQWAGYSDTHLGRFMAYPSTVEVAQGAFTSKNPALDKVLRYCHEVYGPCAETLQKLHEDPLHPRFHEMIAKVRAGRERLGKIIDAEYETLHPTVKTVWDAFLVKRFFTIEDWAQHVEKKRANIFERLSPEHLEFMLTAKGLSDEHILRLEKMKCIFLDDPAAGVLQEGYEYTEEEVSMVRQKAKYYRSVRRFGANLAGADTMPH